MTFGWLGHCATNRKVAGSIPDGFNGILHWHNPSGDTMAVGLTQPPTEMSSRNIFWGVKAAGAYGWQPYHRHVPIVLKSRSFTLQEASGPVQASNGIALQRFGKPLCQLRLIGSDSVCLRRGRTWHDDWCKLLICRIWKNEQFTENFALHFRLL